MTSILELEPILAPQKPAVLRFFGRLVSHRSGFAGFIIILMIVFYRYLCRSTGSQAL
jgi:hypothetical protein